MENGYGFSLRSVIYNIVMKSELAEYSVDLSLRIVAFYQWLTDEEDREFLYNSRVIRYKREGIEEGIKQGTRQGIEQGSNDTKKEDDKVGDFNLYTNSTQYVLYRSQNSLGTVTFEYK